MSIKSKVNVGAYQKAKERAKARSAALTLAGQDIAPIPLPKDQVRRARADRDFKFFCETYFPHLFTLAWSQDHLRVIAKIERVVRYRETLAVAMPRRHPSEREAGSLCGSNRCLTKMSKCCLRLQY